MASTLELGQQPTLMAVPPIVGQSDLTTQPRRVTPEVMPRQTTSISPKLVDAIIEQESRGRPGAVGKAGELGLMQITPGVAQRYGVKFGDLANPEINRRIGTQYLNDLLKEFNGDLMKALAAYNAGPGRVSRGEIPESTRKYVRDVLNRVGGSLSIEGTAYADELPPSAAWKDPKTAPPPWEQPSAKGSAKGAPAAFSTGPAPWAATARPTPAPTGSIYQRQIAPALTAALAWDPYGITKKIFGPNYDPRKVAEAIVPQTDKQGAIQAAMTAMGLGEFGLGWRLLAPVLAGAGVGYLEPGRGESRGMSAAVGGLEGGVGAATGEATGAALGVGGRLAGKAGLLKGTGEDIGAEVGRRLPTGGAGAPREAEGGPAAEFERLYVRKEAINEVEQATRPVRNMIQKGTQGYKFRVPVLVGKGKFDYQDMTFEQAEKALDDLQDIGYAKGGLKTQQAAKRARELLYTTRGQIAAQLNKIGPATSFMGRQHAPWGEQWLTARRQMGTAYALTRVFREPGVIDYETGEINQPALGRAILKRWDDLVRNLGPDGASRLLVALRRNDPRAVFDIVGERPHMGFRAHPGGAYPHLSPGRTYKPVGAQNQIPWYMGRSASFQPALTLAIQKFAEPYENQLENPQ